MISKLFKISFYNCIIVCMLISCTNIDDVYNKKFNFYSFYEDLTIIENSRQLRTQDTDLLKLFIDHKILKDSISWLKTQTYKELFYLAVENAKNGNSNSVMDMSWKTNNTINIVLSSFSIDNGELNLNITNLSIKNIKYFRALLKFEDKMSKKLGQMDLIFNDTILSGNTIYSKFNDKIVYTFQTKDSSEINMTPIIRRVIFFDSTEFVNPLSTFFE
jgi:hypothetical protein